ncbi:HEXXH motif domain-containing protein [Solwaraspora sp. WMMD1047]|uniref:HEXXH motif domain-containing protein n=1 Tax=Solwaraspora sp. WMMD1047 TaxID=3016102 RepID=UPI0024163ABF|nr:HEXXH motif domain-containing protein [Solwaraspora sp. WMMD1047]MDG4831525.1 HEXXH motif domain-containing protein [Solwaraspora sp. WMMD1047]
MSDSEFDQLAGGLGDAALIARLRDGQISKRMLHLRLLLDRLPGSDPLHDHFALLVAADRKRPGVKQKVLGQPHVGTWLAEMVRRVHNGANGGPPSREDLDYLGCVAAVAAWQAGLEFQLKLAPVGHGLMVPEHGLAMVTPDTPVVVSGDADAIHIDQVTIPTGPGGPTRRWQAMRTLRAECDGLGIALRLDDLDPFRDRHRLGASSRLPDGVVLEWQRALTDAWALLTRHHRPYAEAIAAGLTTIVPLDSPSSNAGSNVTSTDAFGATAMTRPADGIGFALGLLHEFQHAKLGALIDIVELYERDEDAIHYAPWRDDPRPVGAVLQGIYAFAGVTDFWRVQRRVQAGGAARVAEAEFVRWRDLVWSTHRTLAATGRFTAPGRRFLDGLREAQQPWQSEPTSTEARMLAAQAAADHRVGWRLRNHHPDPPAVTRLADDYLAGRQCPATTLAVQVRPQPDRMLSVSNRLDLTRLRLTDPDRFAALAQTAGAEVSAGDLALAATDYAAARVAYQDRIVSDPDDLDAWIGLTLAFDRDPASPVKLAAPEICLATYRELRGRGRGCDPVELAGWLAPAAVTSVVAPGRS